MRAARAIRVPDQLTCDELQEIVTQAIWDWGISTGLVSDSAARLPHVVLEKAFREMCLQKSSRDDGGDNSEWMTPQARKWFSTQHDGGVKLSKNRK